MTIVDSIVTAIFMMMFVFFVLAILCGLIKLMSYLLIRVDQVITNKQSVIPITQSSIELNENDAFGGVLILQDVSEPTAAMIMAIVSDESGIPLSNLCFKSIKAIPKTSA